MIYYLNGDYCNQVVSLHHRDRGFLLGDGVFDTVLIKKNTPIFFKEHLDRLNHACESLHIPHRLDLPKAVEIFQQLKIRNNLSNDDCALRITVSRGAGDRGLLFPARDYSPTSMITISPYLHPATKLKSMIASYSRSSQSLSSGYKTLNYLDNIMARNEAAEKDCEEAIMLNEFGRLACGSYSNCFLVLESGEIITPAIAEGALPGIVRSKLIEIASDHNFEIFEERIKLDRLAQGELFFSNSLMGPIAEAKLVSPKAREIFDQIKNIYWHYVDEDIERFQNAFAKNHN